jgi:DNA-binding response OmpR family regulator
LNRNIWREEKLVDIPLRIGIVEDNDDLRDSLVEVLGSSGHVIISFSCAEDVHIPLGGEPFDLMLLDLNLPGEDGLSLANRLKRAQPALRVIMLTTRIGVEDRVRGYDIGADLYLPKPVAVGELLAAIRAIGRQIHAATEHVHGPEEPPMELIARSRQLRGPCGVVQLNSNEVSLLSALASM